MSIITHDFSHAPMFPAEIPDCILTEGFTYGPIAATIRFQPSTGLAKQRNRHTVVPWKMVGNIIVDLRLKGILDAFIKDDLKSGSLPFRKVDPVNSGRSWLFEFQSPQVYTPWQPGHFMTTLQLMRLPNTMQYVGSGFRLIDAAHHQLTDGHKDWLRG